MNLHPIFVHFPIALLSLYVFVEVLRFNAVTRQGYIFYVKAVLVIAGGLGILAALQTGRMATELIRPILQADPTLRLVRRWHSNFADLTAAIFGIVAAAYLIAWISREVLNLMSLRGARPTKQSILTNITESKLWTWLGKFSDFILRPPVIVSLAVLGFVSITITGGLGGIMVYGDKADPFFAFFYRLFIK